MILAWFKVPSFAASIAQFVWSAAVIIGALYAVREAGDCQLSSRRAYRLIVVALIGAFTGALLLGLVDYSREDYGWNVLARGKSFCGGLVGGAMAAALFFRRQWLSALRYGDILVTGLALGYAIGRVGCFLNGCDFGVLTDLPWGVQYPPGTEAYADHLSRGWIALGAASSLPVHPVQLYAAAAGLVMFLVLWRWKPAWPGQRIWLFALFYGIYRFCIEWLRGDFRVFVGPFSLPQVVGILLVAGALTVSCWRWRKQTLRKDVLDSYAVRVV
jgi:phosphatidylglycerol---prolipoprotein diacylglyceryl transferase